MNPRRQRGSRYVISAVAVLITAAIGAGCGSSGSSDSSESSSSSTTEAAAPAKPDWVVEGSYAPTIDPANFVTTIDNRFFPLAPGTGFHYKGVADGVE